MQRKELRCARCEIIRSKLSTGIPTREIARRLGVAASTVRETLRRFEAPGLQLVDLDGMSDGDLEVGAFTPITGPNGAIAATRAGLADGSSGAKAQARPPAIVWDGYIAANLGGYSYSRFCELYRGFDVKLSPTMQRAHAAWFVDYAGDGVPVVIDRLTGEIHKVQIFVAVLGASSFTFAPCELDELARLDRRPCPSSRRSAVVNRSAAGVPDRYQDRGDQGRLYDPQVNRTYAEMAATSHGHFASEAETAEG